LVSSYCVMSRDLFFSPTGVWVLGELVLSYIQAKKIVVHT
jgi:hypothetical protein